MAFNILFFGTFVFFSYRLYVWFRREASENFAKDPRAHEDPKQTVVRHVVLSIVFALLLTIFLYMFVYGVYHGSIG